MTAPSDWPNINYAWSGLLVEELVRLGVSGFVISPGSRSAPLTVSVARNKRAKYWVHFDERGAGFFALGLAKRTGKPAVLICTSGSAAANYWPAVVEAEASGVPLIVITADRPPELLDCGANQAIDQTHLFGRYARWFFALPCPTTDCEPSFVLTTVDQAWHRSQSPMSGPVHLNVAFREPLDPKRDQSAPETLFESLAEWVSGGAPYTRYTVPSQAIPKEVAAALLHDIQCADRGLLIVGRLDNPSDTEAVREAVCALGWRAYADITTGLHGSGAPPTLIGDVGSAVLDAAFTALDVAGEKSKREDTWRPDFVLHLGGGYTSKSLLTYLKHRPTRYLHICSGDGRHDPNHQVSQHVSMDVGVFCRWLSEVLGARPKSVEAPDDDPISLGGVLSEPAVARLLGEVVPADSLLFAGNSMPIRLVERFFRPKQPGVRIAANRGASGIDGNIATALGMAVDATSPTTVLLGDLTSLHDLNSLALHTNACSPVVFIVINNDGGGIFHYLPIAHADEPCFEACFGTPHGLNFAGAAQMFGLAYARPESPSDFVAAYQCALERGGATLIEVRTDRYESRRLQRGEATLLPLRFESVTRNVSQLSPLRPLHMAGAVGSPPLLLVHGFMGDLMEWEFLAKELGESHHVFGINLPGHGPGWNDFFIESCGMSMCADELNAHLDQMGIGPCALAGYSMGGRFALYLATRFPERYTQVILESASPGLDTEKKRKARRMQDEFLAIRLNEMQHGSEDFRTFLEEWYSESLFVSLDSKPELKEELIRKKLEFNVPRHLGQSLRALGTGVQPDLWPALSALTTPTLLITGELDRKFTIIAEDMCRACPVMAMEVLSGCGHNVHLENPSAWLTVVRAFLLKGLTRPVASAADKQIGENA